MAKKANTGSGQLFRLTSPPRLKVRESDVAKACVDLLRWRGYFVLRLQTGLFKTPDGRFVPVGEKGLPDYIAVHERFPGFLLETKRPGEELGPEQILKVEEIRLGFRIAVAVIDSVDAMTPWLDEHERGRSNPNTSTQPPEGKQHAAYEITPTGNLRQ